MMTHNKTVLGFTLALFLTTGSMYPTYGMGKGEDIARNAERYLDKTTLWALYETKYQNGKDKNDKDENGNPYVFRSGIWKCNLFVHDMLYDSGINPPVTSGGWPIKAERWTQNVPRFSRVGSQQRGDIVSDGEHCGIAIDDDSKVIGAGKYTVNTAYSFYDKGRPTIQRYEEF